MNFTEVPYRFNQFTPIKLPFCCLGETTTHRVCVFALFALKKKKKKKKLSFSVNIIVCSHQLVRSKASKASGKRLAGVALWQKDMWFIRFLMICANHLTDSCKCHQTGSSDDKSNCNEFGSA